MAITAPSGLTAQVLEPLLTVEQTVKRQVPAGALVSLEQHVTPPILLATLRQDVRRAVAATTLATLDQAVERQVAVSALVTLEQTVDYLSVDDWEASAPVERQTIYVLDVGDLRVPISSVQATMKSDGQSFVQAIVPDGDTWLGTLNGSTGQAMQLRKGYRYADGSLSPLEVIAEATLDQLRSDEGPTRHSLTLSGHAPFTQLTYAQRDLREVRQRSVTSGTRRVRAAVDTFLRPGHDAVDSDGTVIRISSIQYFIGTASDAMEVTGQ